MMNYRSNIANSLPPTWGYNTRSRARLQPSAAYMLLLDAPPIAIGAVKLNTKH